MNIVQGRLSGGIDAGRAARRARLIDCAEAAVVARGLAGLRARELATAAGCSVGAIYNLVADLDELALLVGQRTMAALEAHIGAAAPVPPPGTRSDGEGIRLLVAWALAYAAFATENRQRWRALFEFRLPPGRELPDWFAIDQARLFGRLEIRLAALLPDLDADQLRVRARTLFSAVHGIVALGIEGKLVALPIAVIEIELARFVETYLSALLAEQQ